MRLIATSGCPPLHILLQVSIAFMYKGEDLSHVCGDARRICYRVFRKKIDDTSVGTCNALKLFPLKSKLRRQLTCILPAMNIFLRLCVGHCRFCDVSSRAFIICLSL